MLPSTVQSSTQSIERPLTSGYVRKRPPRVQAASCKVPAEAWKTGVWCCMLVWMHQGQNVVACFVCLVDWSQRVWPHTGGSEQGTHVPCVLGKAQVVLAAVLLELVVHHHGVVVGRFCSAWCGALVAAWCVVWRVLAAAGQQAVSVAGTACCRITARSLLCLVGMPVVCSTVWRLELVGQPTQAHLVRRAPPGHNGRQLMWRCRLGCSHIMCIHVLACVAVVWW
ncbi:hypothetical protein COO60DRAFT_959220 [Scenedesmus sp. NREL 46B-D3]|nr:hypothetical protein COO60DRAFT_959220 [Scenedesmus sp. NREL 46B-D3]